MGTLSSLLRHRETIRRRHHAVGYFNDRLDGISDILDRSEAHTVLDIGCNRGMVSFQFLVHGASLVHGCDIYREGLDAAREVFSEWSAESRFEYVDLTKGPTALAAAFGSAYRARYDIVLYLAVHQKLKRVMEPAALAALLTHLIEHTGRWFVWRGPIEHFDEIDKAARDAGLRLVQISTLSSVMRVPGAIWQRTGLRNGERVKLPLPET